ncbi:MAG TPA: polyprenyl synthetase family protein [Verrucomicrobiota bacterium]|nr:polyprenyl synthetase family protein [Verrucomicrobiota bacterium]HNU51375.1 polyprenyl synthetase family protein [Verrucomicrobiota bacterium]
MAAELRRIEAGGSVLRLRQQRLSCAPQDRGMYSVLASGRPLANMKRMAPPKTTAIPHPSPDFDFATFLADSTAQVNRALDRFLPKAAAKPSTLHRAMRYSLFAGGKRLRPALCIAAARACGGRPADALPAACAIECIHTYSLIHDDLPAMDNDDFRRGKPTNHKVFGEGIAILAGDALLTVAFEILGHATARPRYSHRDLLRELASAAGSLELVGGQVADLEAEGQKVTPAQLRYIHERKTSALLACAARLGAMSANASPRHLAALTNFGHHVGLAFQVIDDILDVTRTSQELGKTAGKDAAAHKATYPSLLGLERSRQIAAHLTRLAFAALRPFRGHAVALEALATHLLRRQA